MTLSHPYHIDFSIISDIHITHPAPQQNKYKLYDASVEIFEQSLKDARLDNTEFFLIMGDLVEARHFGHANLKIAKDILDKVDLPWYTVIGNHDIRHKSTQDDYDKPDYIKAFAGHGPQDGKAYWRWDVPNKLITIIGLDTTQEFTSFGKIKKLQKEWLIQTLEDIPKEHYVLVCMHHPVVEFNPMIWINALMQMYILDNYKEIAAIFSKYKTVKAVFSGHTHTRGYTALDGIHYISCPSIVSWPNMHTTLQLTKDHLSYTHHFIKDQSKIDEAFHLINSPEVIQNFKTLEKTIAYYQTGPEAQAQLLIR